MQFRWSDDNNHEVLLDNILCFGSQIFDDPFVFSVSFHQYKNILAIY